MICIVHPVFASPRPSAPVDAIASGLAAAELRRDISGSSTL
jgi:hypothetical protein